MLDIRLLRETPEAVRDRLAARGDGSLPPLIDEILECDRYRRAAETRLQRSQADRKRISKEIGMRKGRGEATADLEAMVRGFGEEMGALEVATAELDARQRDLLARLPNLPHASVPVGAAAAANRVVREWGEKPRLAAAPQDHIRLATALGMIDFAGGVRLAGSGFVCFTGPGARLERALIQFMLDLHTRDHGYTEIAPPLLVRPEVLFGTAQLPKFADQQYRVEADDLYLIPTAEVPLTNLHRDEILAGGRLPLKYVGYTPCFRREAGAAGVGTRGLIRVHQFDKVELVRIVHPEGSYGHLEALTGEAEKVLRLLGLHYRVVELCTGDIGFAAAKTYDLEVWAPGQDAYLEVSSCTDFEDFQARRMNLRFKDADGKNRFCHTLNGSGLACSRLLVALLETWQQPDGSVLLPEPLRPYYGAAAIGAAAGG